MNMFTEQYRHEVREKIVSKVKEDLRITSAAILRKRATTH